MKSSSHVDCATMSKLSYGLFILTTKDGIKDNGCVINTAVQLTDNPVRVSITLNKTNHTHDIISKTGVFNLSVLTESMPFHLIEQFGFHSGRDTDKFAASDGNARATNGIRYLTLHTNAMISAKVIEPFDFGTHSLFVAEVTEAMVLSHEPSVTYQYYFDHIKPKPNTQTSKEHRKGFVCKICGYVYEGDTLPDDFICPLCKHGANDFERWDYPQE